MATTDLLFTSISIAIPTFSWVLLGLVSRRLGWLKQPLIDRVSLLSFRYGLPVLLFAGAAEADFRAITEQAYLWSGVLSTFIVLALSWVYGRWRNYSGPVLGVFVQTAFRSNLAIVGTSLVISAYGAQGLALVALPVALMTALYNVLAVCLLNSTHGYDTNVRALLSGIARNPLIIGIALGAACSLSGISLPAFALGSVEPLSAVFLPLVLVCVGGSMSFASLRSSGLLSWEAVLWRLCLSPLIVVLVSLALGVRGEHLGTLFLLTASPVAAASFVMILAVRGDGVMAANMIVLTTLLSPLTVMVGYFCLGFLQLL